MFSAVVIMAKLFGKSGMIAWAAVGAVLANLIVPKQVRLFGMDVTLANVMFSSVFLATDIIS